MAINTSGILKTPQGSAIQNAEIIFEQTRTSTEVLAGTKVSVITNQTGNYSSSLGVGTYVFKVRFQDETQYRTVASNVIVTQSMNDYTLNQIIQDQSQLQDVDYDLLQDVIQARDQAAASKQAAQSSQATASTKASEASSSAQAALASKNAAQTSEANALSSKNAAQTSQTNAANSQTAAATSQTTATTKATEASNSAQAALTSKNAAQTSETNALASKNAAQASQTTSSTKASEAAASQTTASTKASEAVASQTQAQQSQSDAGAAASQADTSKQQAQQSQTSASTSQATATTKASEASSSAQAALASKNAAQTSETNALASKNQAQTSQTNAANSQTAAAGSQTTATTKAGEASTSQTNAANSQTTATTKAGEASTSQTNAATSQTTATTKAGEASSSQTAAAGSQSTATTKATEATNSATLAQKWAANPENSIVSGGLYSALHYAAKAAQSAQTAAGQLVWRGGWSAQAGTAPPTPTGTTQDFYRITQAGTILSVQYEIGDYIHWDNINSIWFKMDGTDSVISVNGRTGAVVVTKTDVGLSAVNNWGASSQTNDASTTTYATTAGVKAAYDLAATKLAATANAVSATKLVTARTINGTSFDGTANITTQNWGTSRNLTIGGTAKAVNGSADISWTLDEIGAAPAGYGLGAPTSTQSDANGLGIVSGFFGAGGDSQANFYTKYQPLLQMGRQGGADGTGQLTQLQADHDTRTLAYRTRVGNIWTSWGVLYSSLNKPTAADLSVVPDTRTVNGKRLNADVALVPQDLGTLTTSEIEALGRKSITINQPAGLVQGKYYPIVVTNYYNDQALYITTRSSGGSDPMNNCSFDGIVRQAGWSDKSSIVDGVFTAYSSSERAIHSIIGSSEQEGAYAIYVEARQFPIVLRVQGSQTVQCTGASISHGTSTFVAQVDNPSAITGATNKLNMLADFAKGSGRYRGGSLYYHEGNNPTAQDVQAVPLAGAAVLQDYLSIQGHNTTGAITVKRAGLSTFSSFGQAADGSPIIGNTSTQNGAAFAQYLKVGNTALVYSNGSTTTNVFHEGYVPTAATVGAMAASSGIVTTQDWNTLTVAGSYSVQNFTGANSPQVAGHPGVYTYGTLLVQNNSETISQMYITDGDRIYLRDKFRSNGWGTWKPVSSDESMVIDKSIDLNDFTMGGTFNMYKGSGVTFTNAPSGFSYGTLYVIGRASTANQFVTQTLTQRGSLEQWIRTRSDGIGTWTAWNKIYNEAQKPTPADIGALQAGATAVAATKLATARTISGVSFDGTANITLTAADVGALGVTATAAKANLLGNTNLNTTLTAYIAPPSLNWWGDCGIGHSQMVKSGNGYTGSGYVFKIGARDTGNGHAWIGMTDYGDGGNLIFGANASGSAAPVWATVYSTRNKPTADDVGALPSGGTAVAAAKLATARTIGGVSFDGTANINLPGVNTAGNQSTTGNAATATKLATPRTIAGVSFDGSANISLSASNVGAVPTTQLLPLSGGTINWDDLVGKVPVINSVGVTELGRYLDMREQGANVDFQWRWDAGAAGANKLGLYNSGGSPVIEFNASGRFNVPVNGGDINGRVKVYGFNPMYEWHVPGKYAAAAYLTSSNDWRFVGSDGVGGETNYRFVSFADGRFITLGAVLSDHNTDSAWNQFNTASFRVNNIRPMANGAYCKLISHRMLQPSVFDLENSFGAFVDGTGWDKLCHTLVSTNGSDISRIWKFRNDGTMYGPTGNVFGSDGNTWGSVFGGSSLTSWAINRFALISDVRYKKNMTECDGLALDVIDKFRFYAYDWDDSKKIVADKHHVKFGVSAQELELIDKAYVKESEVHEVMGEDPTTIKTLDDSNLLTLALKAIQELRAEIQELKKR